MTLFTVGSIEYFAGTKRTAKSSDSALFRPDETKEKMRKSENILGLNNLASKYPSRIQKSKEKC